MQFPVNMRAIPTGDDSAGTGFSVNVPAGRIAGTAMSASGSSTFMATMIVTVSSGLTTGQGATLEIDTATDWVEWRAEL